MSLLDVNYIGLPGVQVPGGSPDFHAIERITHASVLHQAVLNLGRYRRLHLCPAAIGQQEQHLNTERAQSVS
jgi:hypothetical protein